MKLNIHVDGGSKGNPGPAAAGVVIGVVEPPELLHEAGYFLGVQTPGSAEYHGLIRALEIVSKLKADEVCIYSDSEQMVNQITGMYRVKSEDLLPLFTQAQMMLLRFDTWQIKHIVGDENKRADELVKVAIEEGRDVVIKHADQADAAPSSKLSSSSSSASSTTEPLAAQALKLVPQSAAATVAWRVTLGAKVCPFMSPDASGKTYEFGPLTPMGLCVHAADAVFDCNPLGQLHVSQARLSTSCAKCGVAVRLEHKDKD